MRPVFSNISYFLKTKSTFFTYHSNLQKIKESSDFLNGLIFEKKSNEKILEFTSFIVNQ